MKKVFLFSLGFLTALSIFFLLWHFNVLSNSLLDSIAGRDKASVEVLNRLPSPDGEYVATTNRVSNKMGWCEVRINVKRKDVPFDWEQEFVCITGCGTRLEQRWQDDQHLNILYWNDDATTAVKTYQQFQSQDQAIQISYTLKQ